MGWCVGRCMCVMRDVVLCCVWCVCGCLVPSLSESTAVAFVTVQSTQITPDVLHITHNTKQQHNNTTHTTPGENNNTHNTKRKGEGRENGGGGKGRKERKPVG